jgi:hypothetical protein
MINARWATLLKAEEDLISELWKPNPFGRWIADGPGWSMTVIYRVNEAFYYWHAEANGYATSGKRETLFAGQLAAQNALERIRDGFSSRAHPSTVPMNGEAG